MGTLELPNDLQQSYLDCRSYPCNLSHRGTGTYPSALTAHKTRLDQAEPSLFADGDTAIEVPIRDLYATPGDAVKKLNAHTAEKLSEWLGAVTTSEAGRRIVRARKRDPKCRFIYIYGDHSRARLKITRSMLAEIFTYHQVMPVYLDFVSVFGQQSKAKDLRFSGFREQMSISNPPRGPYAPDIGRSGRQYQLSYNLKCVALKNADAADLKLHEWSVQQAAIHHQFDVVEGTTLWIVTKGHLDIQQRFKELTGPHGRPEDKAFGTVLECFRSSLSAHLLYCHWSLDDWRGYIRHLEDILESETDMAILGRRERGFAHQQYRPAHIQDLQWWEEKANIVVMALEANLYVLGSLVKFYLNLQSHKDFPLANDCADDVAMFVSQVENMIDDFKMQISRARLLSRTTKDRKELVLQHLQSQGSERMERLNRNMENEAVLTRIITVVTLLYLPATFTSTFFSTDIIKYQDPNGGRPGSGTYSTVAMQRWLQVTLPLTAITLLGAFTAKVLADRRRTTLELFGAKQKQARGAGGRTKLLLPFHSLRKLT